MNVTSELIDRITCLVLEPDTPKIPNTSPIHPVLRNTIPLFQDLKTDFLPWLFEPGKRILLKDGSNKIYLEWKDISFSTTNSNPQVICQYQQEGFYNNLNLQYAIIEDNEREVMFNVTIPIPIVSGYGETDSWGIKQITARPYTLGGYTLTGKGMQKYPISIEQDRYYFGQAKKKMLLTDTPQFAFTIDKDLFHPADRGQTPQHFKVVLSYKTFDLMISCNNSHSDLKLPEVNVIKLISILTERSINEVGESLKCLDYSGDKTEEIHAVIDSIIQRATEMHDEFSEKITVQTIANLMSQYDILQYGVNKRKGYMIELQIRRMIMALFAPNFYPDRDSLQRKRYIGCGNYIAQVFMSKVIDICNIKNNSKLTDRNKITRELDRLLGSITITISTDISTGTYDKKTGVWVHDSSTSTINSISKLTACAKKLVKEITKDLTFRYFHPSQVYSLCPYDVPEHGENVGLVNSTTILARLTHLFPSRRKKLAMQIYKEVLMFQKHKPSSYEFYVIIDDLLVGRLSKTDAKELYYDLRYKKREGRFIEKDFGVVYDPYLHEVRINIATGRIVQPILVITDGKLELSKISQVELSEFLSTKPNLESFMNRFPHVLEFVDVDCLQVSTDRNGRLMANIQTYQSSDLETRKLSDYCLMTPWGYLGWNINHIPLRNHDEAIRSVFYCSLSKSGIHNKILVRNHFDSYHRVLYTELPLYTNPVIATTMMDRLAYCEVLYTAMIPTMSGINQEDGSVFNRDSRDVGMLSTIRVIKYIIQNVDKTARLTSTTRVVKHGSQDKIDPVNGLPIVGSYLVKGDAIIRNFEQISTSTTGVTHKDVSELYTEHTPARVERVILTNNPSVANVLLVTHNPIMNGDKISTISAQKSTAVAVIERSQLPCTIDGLYPNIIMSPTGPLTRKIPSTVLATMPMVNAILQWCNLGLTDDRIQVRLASIEETFDWTKSVDDLEKSYNAARKKYDSWPNQSSRSLAQMSHIMIHPQTKEIMEDVCVAPIHIYRSKHLANPKKNICPKGRVSQETGQTTSKRKSGGAPKFDEMSRTVGICYGAAYTLWDLLSDPDDRKQFVHVCTNCGMFANYVSNKDESYHVCDVCLNRYQYSSVMQIEQTYAARKFFDYPRARGIQIVLHPNQKEEVLYRYKS